MTLLALNALALTTVIESIYDRQSVTRQASPDVAQTLLGSCS